jgi:hypothetical protein
MRAPGEWLMARTPSPQGYRGYRNAPCAQSQEEVRWFAAHALTPTPLPSVTGEGLSRRLGARREHRRHRNPAYLPLSAWAQGEGATRAGFQDRAGRRNPNSILGTIWGEAAYSGNDRIHCAADCPARKPSSWSREARWTRAMKSQAAWVASRWRA